MKSNLIIFFLLFSIVSIHTISGQNLENQIDELMQEQYQPDAPGATILVAKKGGILYHKAFGKANLELDIAMKPENVFEIGSITKQFTAVSILMLLEQGKLNLDDEITKFIPDYPTHDKKITVHHLLNHTSGIKSYTSMNLMEIARKDMTPKELIDYFKNEPMDFDPGTEWRYNNSGYILLGFIIEKVSGKTYEDFVEQHIFKPLQMEDSYYGHMDEIIKNRASGYQKRGDSYHNAAYLSLTLPYAAGSLMSNVTDLYKWQKAINANTLVKEETIKKAYQNYTLNNGKSTYYGYGWSINEINGSPTIEHSGGIFGYTTNEIYLPEEDVYVTAFSNCDCNPPGEVTTKIAALAIDKPYGINKNNNILPEKDLKKLVGVYEFEDKAVRFITLEGNQLYSQREGSNKFKIFPKDNNTFLYDESFSEIEFNIQGQNITAIFKNRINKSTGSKTNKPLPTEKVAIEVEIKVLKNYVGVYEIQPGFDITITLEESKLMAQATGQGKLQLHAETETKFFIKEVAASLVFSKDKEGKYNTATLLQGGRSMPAKRKN